MRVSRRATLALGGVLLTTALAVGHASARTARTVAATATAAPVASPSASPTVSPSAASGSGAPATAAPYRFVYKPTPTPATQTTPFPGPNPPQIAEIDLSDATLVTPGTIRVRVLTSDSVASVVAETFGNTFAIPKKQPGLFTFEGYVGDVPAFVKNRTYDVTFTASTTDGRIDAVSLPLTLR